MFDSYILEMMYIKLMKNFLVADSNERLLLDSFGPPGLKNVWFLLSRHDERRVHEKYSSRRFERADGC